MSKLDVQEFRSLVSNLAEDRTNDEVIRELNAKYKTKLERYSSYIIRNAVINLLRNARRRSAVLILENGRNLFEGQSVPALTARMETDGEGRRVWKNIPTGQLTKSELKERIEVLRKRPRRKSLILRAYEMLYNDIDKLCSEYETIEIGLTRRLV